MTNKPDRILLSHLFQSFVTTWALMKASRMEPGNILTFVFFLLVFFFYRHVNRRMNLLQLSNRVALVTAVLFTLLYMLVDYPHYVELLTSRLYRAGILVIIFTGFVCLFYYLLHFLYSYACNRDRLYQVLLTRYQDVPYFHNSRYKKLSVCLAAVINFIRSHTAFCAFLACLAGWFPYYLYQYPGIMTPDSINQLEQILGVVSYSNHHPWVHTLVFGFFYRIGFALTKDMVIAVSVYTLFQMCLLAGSIAFFISTLRAHRIRPFVLLLITAFYALIPYHAVFSVTVWKDIPFAAAVLFFGCSILRLSVQDRINFKNLSVFFLSGLAICLFRSNG